MKTLSKILTIGLIISLFSAYGKNNDLVARWDVIVEEASEIEDEPFVVQLEDKVDGVIINGIRWATRNVDAPGTFAESPESSGMLFQWNRRVGWSSTNPIVNSDGETVWDDSMPTGTKWYAENDPCPEGWRVPTSEELFSLTRASSSDFTYNDVRGRVFGTAPYQIFLPFVGTRGWQYGCLPIPEVHGIGGNYWSSSSQQYSGARSLRLLFALMDNSHRVAGLSIRCVAKD